MKKHLILTILLLTNLYSFNIKEIKENSKIILEKSIKKEINIVDVIQFENIKNITVVIIENKEKKRIPFYTNGDGTILIPFNSKITANKIIINEFTNVFKKINNLKENKLKKKIIINSSEFNKEVLKRNLIKMLKKISDKIFIEDIYDIKGFEYFKIIELKTNKNSTSKLIFSNLEGTFFFPFSTTIITNDVKKLNIIKTLVRINKKNKELRKKIKVKTNKDVEIYNKIKTIEKKNIILLNEKFDEHKDTLFLFLDPECPFCKEELTSLKNEIDFYNVKIIFTPVHKRPAFVKSQFIYNEINSSLSFDEKMNILNKYFNKNQKNSRNIVNTTNINTILLNKKVFLDTKLIISVPYRMIIDENK